MARPRRFRLLALAGLAIAPAGLLAACGGNEAATPSRTIPAACLEAETVVATAPPGTDAAGSTLPAETVPKPTVSMPPAPVTELEKIDVKVGDGAEVQAGDTVKAHYVGWSCSTGKQFDSSWDRGTEPVEFPLANVIPGWSEGLVGMKVGGQRVLIVPGSMAYNAANPPPAGSGIAINDTLAFVVDLVETGPTPTTTTAPATSTTVAGAPGETTTSVAPASTDTTTTTAP